MKNKKIINYKPKYNPGDIVFAADIVKGTDYDTFARIFKVNIESVLISEDGVSYWVSTIKGKQVWGNNIPESHVNIDKKVLMAYLFDMWNL